LAQAVTIEGGTIFELSHPYPSESRAKRAIAQIRRLYSLRPTTIPSLDD
jgi:hypothetical protein